MSSCVSCGSANPEQARFCSTCGHELAIAVARPKEMRRIVTVLFTDIVDSTRLGARLDPEPFSHVLSAFYEWTRRGLELHGGTVFKYAGDAVVAIFGIPALHEDDALRAVRSALELRSSLPDLNHELEREFRLRLAVRTAINTGEVVVSNPVGVTNPAVLGDTVNVAARLQTSAGTDEILLGFPTYRLVRDLVLAEQLSPLSLKGKDAAVPAWRLLALKGQRDLNRRLAAPLIGRERDLALLDALVKRATSEARIHLVTLVGEAGVGKTRLLRELSDRVGEQATVLFGRCRPYGDDITFRPLVQIIRSAVDIRSSDPLSAAEPKLRAFGEADGRVVTRIAQLLGLRSGSGEPGDTHWALRRALELLAEQRPLVAIIDDLHAAQPSLIDCIEYIVGSCKDVPIVLVCLARPEFLDDRRDWCAGKPNTYSVLLSPLLQEDTEKLIECLLTEGTLPTDLREAIANASAGNPFFAEELVASLLEDGALRLDDRHWVAAGELAAVLTSPRIEALLAARLDRLEPIEQAIIERAAVVGDQFGMAEVAALLVDVAPAQLAGGLHRLAGYELLRLEPAPASPRAEEQLFRFRHKLIRDAAYHRILKGDRAKYHERHADWLEHVATERVWTLQLDEVIGRHLWQAHRYRTELGWTDAATRALGRRAGVRLAVAGHRAVLQGNASAAAVELLTDAVNLLTDNDEDRRVALLNLAAAQQDASQDARQFELALRTCEEALAASTAAGDRRRGAEAVLGRLDVLSEYDLERLLREGRAEIRAAIQVLEQLDGPVDLYLARASRLLAFIDWATGRLRNAAREVDEAINHARRAGNEVLQGSCLRLQCFILMWGPQPLDEVIQVCEAARGWGQQHGIRLEKDALAILAQAAGMQGDFDRAHELLRSAKDLKADEPTYRMANVLSEAAVHLLEERPAEAVAVLEERAEGHAIALAMLARALTLLGRDEEAEQRSRQCEAIATRHQLDAQIKWREIRAVTLAHQGRLDEAEQLAREAASLAETSEQPDSKAQALTDLAEVLTIAGRSAEAVPLLERALGLYLEKGNVVMARLTRRTLVTAGV